MQICFLTQTKIENWQKTAKLTFLCYDILVKKGSLHRNGNAAIPKSWEKRDLGLLLKYIAGCRGIAQLSDLIRGSPW